MYDFMIFHVCKILLDFFHHKSLFVYLCYILGQLRFPEVLHRVIVVQQIACCTVRFHLEVVDLFQAKLEAINEVGELLGSLDIEVLRTVLEIKKQSRPPFLHHFLVDYLSLAVTK